MSKNNNVNPGQYKVAGRERPGEDVLANAHKAELSQAQAQQKSTPRQPPAQPQPRTGPSSKHDTEG
jgi:hypothetical protein